MKVDDLKPGTRISVSQPIRRRDGNWIAEASGELLEVSNAPTGSWYAHGKDNRYWLKRIKLRKANGEITILSLEPDSRVVVLDD